LSENHDAYNETRRHAREEPSIAPGIGTDELELDATPEEIERGDYTQVSRLALDFTPDTEEK
jgi:hypothetical protein